MLSSYQVSIIVEPLNNRRFYDQEVVLSSDYNVLILQVNKKSIIPQIGPLESFLHPNSHINNTTALPIEFLLAKDFLTLLYIILAIRAATPPSAKVSELQGDQQTKQHTQH